MEFKEWYTQKMIKRKYGEDAKIDPMVGEWQDNEDEDVRRIGISVPNPEYRKGGIYSKRIIVAADKALLSGSATDQQELSREYDEYYGALVKEDTGEKTEEQKEQYPDYIDPNLEPTKDEDEIGISSILSSKPHEQRQGFKELKKETKKGVSEAARPFKAAAKGIFEKVAPESVKAEVERGRTRILPGEDELSEEDKKRAKITLARHSKKQESDISNANLDKARTDLEGRYITAINTLTTPELQGLIARTQAGGNAPPPTTDAQQERLLVDQVFRDAGMKQIQKEIDDLIKMDLEEDEGLKDMVQARNDLAGRLDATPVENTEAFKRIQKTVKSSQDKLFGKNGLFSKIERLKKEPAYRAQIFSSDHTMRSVMSAVVIMMGQIGEGMQGRGGGGGKILKILDDGLDKDLQIRQENYRRKGETMEAQIRLTKEHEILGRQAMIDMLNMQKTQEERRHRKMAYYQSSIQGRKAEMLGTQKLQLQDQFKKRELRMKEIEFTLKELETKKKAAMQDFASMTNAERLALTTWESKIMGNTFKGVGYIHSDERANNWRQYEGHFDSITGLIDKIILEVDSGTLDAVRIGGLGQWVGYSGGVKAASDISLLTEAIRRYNEQGTQLTKTEVRLHHKDVIPKASIWHAGTGTIKIKLQNLRSQIVKVHQEKQIGMNAAPWTVRQSSLLSPESKSQHANDAMVTRPNMASVYDVSRDRRVELAQQALKERKDSVLGGNKRKVTPVMYKKARESQLKSLRQIGNRQNRG